VSCLKVGIIGCGFIGCTLANAAQELEEVEDILLMDTTLAHAERAASSLSKCRAVESLDEILAEADLVVEAANQDAVKEYAPRVLVAGKDLMIMSIGALVDDDLWNGLKETAKGRGCRVFLPSGGIGGLDLLKAASQAQLSEVQLVTTKPPRALASVPEITSQGIDLASIREPVVVFEGTAREAVSRFPKNINVAATVALAGVGFDRTTVKIIADPGMTRNYHELIVEGRFGKMRMSILNAPSSTNPKTSYLAALSAISTMKNIVQGVWIGA
jgi:aspartate dehydrogenase